MKHLFTFLIACLFITACKGSQPPKNWTIMYYAVGSNSSETDLMSDIQEMMDGKNSSQYEVIMLIDRVEGFSNDSLTLGDNFTDTRLYQLGSNTYTRLGGRKMLPQISPDASSEINMADANILKRFIQYCKQYYPANHYMLVLRSHGNGVGMCPDAESGMMDRLYPGEMADVLSQEESVDILGLDVCSMAGLENLYEWRPGTQSFSADYVIASAPLSGAWAYDQIFNRLQDDVSLDLGLDMNYFDGGRETNLQPGSMTPTGFAQLIIEEIYDSQQWASWGLFDNTKISEVKLKMDAAALLLAEEEKAIVNDIIQQSLPYHHDTHMSEETARMAFPYVDAYHFWDQIAHRMELKPATRSKAKAVCESIDELVIHSYYGRGFLPETDNFTNGKTGVYQILPLGNTISSQTGRSFWAHTSWFHPGNQTAAENAYGLYDWCIEGAIQGNKKVDNFFEYLDYLFDTSNTETGGVNHYQW